jgi:tetratricopeptide (TPR) repeat protein
MKKIDRSRLVVYVTVLLLFAAIAVLVIFPLCDYDTFWHVAMGRAIVNTGHIVNEEIFSYTSYGTHFSNHEWLSQIILFLVYHQWGASGLIGFKVILTLAICAILYRTARMLGARPVVAALLCLFVVIAGLTRFRVRPQLFSFLFLVILQMVLYGYRAERFGKRALYVLPPLMVFWDFLHGAIYGLLFLGAFVAGESLTAVVRSRYRSRLDVAALSSGRLRALWTWTGVTLIAMLLNPYGPRSYAIFTQFVKGSNLMVSLTVEFMPTPLKGYLPFWFLLAATFLTLWWALKRIDLTQVLVFIPFGYLAVRYTRGMEAFNLVALPLVAVNTRQFFELKNRKETVKYVINALMALAVIASVAYAGYYKFLAPRNKFSFGDGFDENSFPMGCVRFIKAVNLRGHMYNTDGFGGYLAYFVTPERKIFYYSHPTAFKAIEYYIHDPAALEKCDINYAVVGREEELDMFLRKKFVPVYWEPSGIVLVRNNEQNRDIINRYAIRFFQPLLSDTALRELAADRRVFPILMREMATYLSYRRDPRIADLFAYLMSRPNAELTGSERVSLLLSTETYNADNPRLLASVGMAYYRQKDLDHALVMFTRALSMDKSAEDIRLNLAYVHFDMRNFQEAAKEFERVLAKEPSNADAVYGLALTRYQMEEFGLARKLFEQYLRLVPEGTWAENARALMSTMH